MASAELIPDFFNIFTIANASLTSQYWSYAFTSQVAKSICFVFNFLFKVIMQ